MSLAFPSTDFDQAVAAVCHGSATDSQLRDLNLLLRNHPAARDEYILRLELHSRLASEPDLFTRDNEAPMLVPTNRPAGASPRRFTPTLWHLALAACVALLLTGAWWAYQSTPSTRQGNTSKAVAMLNRVADAAWHEPSESPRLGAPLEPGWLRLRSGLAQVVFYSGARLVIEGPAEVQLVSSSEVVCLGGRLIAEVPPPAKGFRIRTPKLNVTDLGTVFGLDVTPLETEVHVFKGSVEVQSTTTITTTQRMLEGHASRTDGVTPMRSLTANRARFASLFDLHYKSSEGEVLRHEQWRAASSRLDDDPTLLVHLDCESTDPSDWRLANASRRKDVMQEATIVGCQWTEGRWPDKRALEFRGVSDRVRLEVEGEYEALTLAMWARIQGLDRQINSLFMSDGFESGTVHWSIRHDGVMALTAIGAEPGEFQICTSPTTLRLDQFGLWVHLAVVIDGTSKRVTQFLNGRPVSEHALKIAAPFRVGVAELGNWNARGFPKQDPFMIRNFSGAIDDFCVFSRALTKDELRALYLVGKPQPGSGRQALN